MKNPRVSVIIGSYNCEKFIKDTIFSVIDQTFKDWELIVVDDCSTDTTTQKVQEISDVRIRLVKLEENSGRPAVPRNKGIQLAQGEFIAFLDHDDLWLPEKLEKQLKLFDEDKELFLVYAKCYVQKDGQIIDVSPHNPRAGYIFEALYSAHNLMPCSTVMIKNTFGEKKYLFNEDKQLAAIEDYDLWLSITYREKVSFVDEPLCVYRVYAENMSSGMKMNLFFKKYKIVIKKFSHLVPKKVLIRKYISFYKQSYISQLKFALRSLLSRAGSLLINERD